MKELKIEDLNPKLNPILIRSDAQLPQLEDFLAQTEVFAVDTETNLAKTFYERKIRCIQIGNKDTQIVIDLLGFNNNLFATQGNYQCHPSYKNLVAILKKYFETNKTTKVLFNAHFDYTMLKWCLGIKLWNLYDCFIAEQNIYIGKIPFTVKDFWALDDCVLRYTGLKISKEEQKTFDLTSPLTEKQIIYAALDTRLPLAVMKGQEPVISAMGIGNAIQVDFEALPAFGDQHLNGLLLDKKLWKERMLKIKERKTEVVAEMDKVFIPIVGRKDALAEDLALYEHLWRSCEEREERKRRRKDFEERRRNNTKIEKLADKCEGLALLDYESPKQLLEALWKTGIPKGKLKDTSERTLGLLASEYKIIELLREYRGLNKLNSTYNEPYIESIDQNTGRIHAEFRLIGAKTGRPSCAAPNLYNIPNEPQWRECFISRPGYKMITADFDGQELRILTEVSQEPTWVEAFKNGWDVHSVVAEIIYGEEWQSSGVEGCAYFKDHKKCKCPAHAKLRNAVKSINFGIAYGMTEKKLSDELNISIREARELLHIYYKAVPTLIKYLEASGKSARNTLTSRTIAGRIRHYLRPTFEFATQKTMEDMKVKKQDRADATFKKIFIARNKKLIDKKLFMMGMAIEREGKNAVIQGTGCDMLKTAMGSGFDQDGKPFLWHHMDELGMFLENNVYDELLIEVPEENVVRATEVINDCMVRAGNRYVKTIPFKTEIHVENCWTK